MKSGLRKRKKKTEKIVEVIKRNFTLRQFGKGIRRSDVEIALVLAVIEGRRREGKGGAHRDPSLLSEIAPW